jgi:hypothetical protein
LGLIEKEGGHRFAHIATQFIPRIPLREDVVREALGDKASISLLRHTEDDFHGRIPSLRSGLVNHRICT